VNSRKIGNVNEGIVEGGEDAGNAENELACFSISFHIFAEVFSIDIPSPARGPRETFSLAAAGALVLGAIASVVGWMEYRKKEKVGSRSWMRKKWVCALAGFVVLIGHHQASFCLIFPVFAAV
jgi:hypothetical protein